MIISRLKMILTEAELSRLSINEKHNGKLKITADVHGMKCREARKFINNIINIIHSTFQLIIIHGYNHGTAIKEMLANNFNNDHIYEQFPDPYNQGITHMLIAA